MRSILSLLFALVLLPGAAPAADLDVVALLTKVDDSMRGDSSSSTVTMEVKTSHFERSITMENWTEGTEKSLIRILAPAKDRGVSTLKVGDNLWNYLPNTDRIMKVPASMMSGAWMGSHLTNDDLVRETRFSEDYTFTVGARDGDEVTIRCTPKPDAPVVWSRVDVRVTLGGIPREQIYFDEDGAAVRTITFSDVQSVGDRQVPMTMLVTPQDKPGEYTKMTISDLTFDIDAPPGLFSLQSLKR